jgi:Tfp pilus assembly protein PilO
VTRQQWLDDRRRWALPLALLLVGVAVLGWYQLAFADRVGVLRAEVDRETAELEQLRIRRQGLEELVARAERSRDGVRELYDVRFATESERITEFIREVKELAERAGLRPSSFSYPDVALEDYGLIERSVVFSVDGGYRELRQFVNFLELTDSFVILRSIQVRGNSSELGLSLQLATLFSGRDAGERAPGAAVAEDAGASGDSGP